MPAQSRTHEEKLDEMVSLIFAELMQKYFGRASRLGLTRESQTPEEFYGFKACDVADYHHYRVGEGDGFWFRLKDGRVFCAYTGLPAPPGTEDYDDATLN
ncbi:MAG: hypothetical protein SFV18_17595 [Bryobacteraceae bacterium]|nr:hypothetical protein [Bryobacteraceae bacterium]